MEQKEKGGKKTGGFRWLVPLLAAILSLAWEGMAFGLQPASLGKGVFAFIGLGVFYNWLVGWLKDKPGQRPPKLELILALPAFTVIIFAAALPFPYIRPWLPAGLLTLAGYELWGSALGFSRSEKGTRSGCTVLTTAIVMGNIKGRVSHQRGKISQMTFYPVLAYEVDGARIERPYDNGLPRPLEPGSRVEIRYNLQSPEVFRFSDQNTDRSVSWILPLFGTIGTAFLIAAIFSVIFKW